LAKRKVLLENKWILFLLKFNTAIQPLQAASTHCEFCGENTEADNSISWRDIQRVILEDLA